MIMCKRISANMHNALLCLLLLFQRLVIQTGWRHLLRGKHWFTEFCTWFGIHHKAWPWPHFWRAKVGVCVWCSCVQNTGKEALHSCWKKLLLLKCTAASWLRICPPEVKHLTDICKPFVISWKQLHDLVCVYIPCAAVCVLGNYKACDSSVMCCRVPGWIKSHEKYHYIGTVPVEDVIITV